jgi:hypothetical protein
MKYISFDYLDLVQQYNGGLHSLLQVGGHCALDEQMWHFFGLSAFIQTLECKPSDSTGLVAYLLCFELTHSGLPVVYHLLPALCTPIYTGTEIMDILTSQIPPNTTYSLSANSHFGNIGWLEAHRNQHITVALTTNDTLGLGPLFSYNLPYRQYRVFSNGKVLFSVWKDNSVIFTLSSSFSIGTGSVSSTYGGRFSNFFSIFRDFFEFFSLF